MLGSWRGGNLILAVALNNLAVALAALTALPVLTLSVTARADGPATGESPRVAHAGSFVRDTSATVGSTTTGHASHQHAVSFTVGSGELPAALCLPPGAEVSETPPPAADTPRKKKSGVARCGPEGCGYKALLGHLVITRDLELPGSSSVAVRLLPTSHALAGDSRTPIVVRPRVQGAYGVHLAARF